MQHLANAVRSTPDRGYDPHKNVFATHIDLPSFSWCRIANSIYLVRVIVAYQH